MVSPSQPATLNFEKPPYGYDSGYCMLLNTGKQMKEKKINLNNEWDFLVWFFELLQMRWNHKNKS